MKASLLKAKARKKKFLKRKKVIHEDEDSDMSMSSDDEEQYSENIVGNLIHDKYLIVKYLGRGAFCKVWLVYEICNMKYYALKIQEPKYNEDMEEEIKILNHLQKKIKVGQDDLTKYNFGVMLDNFGAKIGGILCRCMVLELLGNNIAQLCYSEHDNKLNTKIIQQVIYGVVKGLDDIHSKGIIHTDMKTDNILFVEIPKSIMDYQKKIDDLQLYNNYNSIFEASIPKEISMLEKNKRKMLKRKIRQKTLKEVVKSFKKQIIEINGEEMDNNIELKIEELKDNDLDLDLDTELEDTVREKNIEDINLDNLQVKIIDFGNSEFFHEKNQEEIYTRSYRPPENIINSEYSNKSDIWFVGCFLYELLTGDVLFDVLSVDNKNFEKDREHLYQMFSILGKIPREMSMNCEFSEDLFDMKGRILKNKSLENRNLREELKSRILIESDELDLIEDLIYKILEYDPNIRFDASQILNHKWFQYHK